MKSLDLALSLASKGFSVFPVHGITDAGACTCEKITCDPKTKGKHPWTRHGFKDASTDPEEIRHLFQRKPNANVGLATYDLAVVDIDPRNGGSVEAVFGDTVPETPTTDTGGGGVHFIFRAPQGVKLPSVLATGVDIKSGGPYVIAPGSLHASGKRYAWRAGRSIDDVALAPFPLCILEQLSTPNDRNRRPIANHITKVPRAVRRSYAQRALESEIAAVVMSPAHVGNAQLNTSAFNLGQLVGGGELEEQDVVHGLLLAAVPRRPEEEARATIRSGMEAGMRQPRTSPPTTRGPSMRLPTETPGELVPFLGRRVQPKSSSRCRTNSAGLNVSGLPEINAADGDLARVAERAWAALANANIPQRWFLYSSIPSRVESDEQGAAVRLLTEDSLRGHLARAATWYKEVEDRKTGDVLKIPAHPPIATVKDMLASEAPPLPRLIRIVSAPPILPNGTVGVKPGYYADTQTYYAPRPGFVMPPVPQHPTDQDRLDAYCLIVDELLCDFPFLAPRNEELARRQVNVERAHAIAAMLCPLVRDLIDGPTPLHMIEKTSPGTGGTLLANVLALPAIGVIVDAMTLGKDEESIAKKLTAKLMQGPSVLLLDNISKRGVLDSESLSSAITADIYEDRILGVSKTARMKVRCAWMGTGNNPRVSHEIARRTVRIRLDAHVDRPWLRDTTSFRHRLPAWAMENRGEILRALYILVLAWFDAGRPPAPAGRSLGMFESWSEVIGGILFHASIPGFLGNLDEFYERTDAEGAAMRRFIETWAERHGDSSVTTATLYEMVKNTDIFDLTNSRGERGEKSKLGKIIAGHVDTKVGVHTITKGPTVNGSATWRLVRDVEATS
jgi:hypothetical protein